MLTDSDRNLIRIKWLRMVRYWRRFNLDAILQASAFFLLLGLFWTLCFAGISRLCNNLSNVDVIGPIILTRFLSLGFFAASLIVFLGHALTAFGSLFRGHELPLLMSTPYHLSNMYRVQCVEALIRGGWGLAMLCIPVLLAYGWALNAPLTYYPIAMIGLLGFWAIIGLAGIIMMVTVANWILGRPIRTVIASNVVLIGMFLLVAFVVSNNSDLFTQVNAKAIGERLANMQLSSLPYLPNQWLASLMTDAANQDWKGVAVNLFLLLSGAFLLWQITLEIGECWYREAWLWSQERIRFFKTRESQEFYPRGLRAIPFLPRGVGSILLKEIRLFIRDFSQWGQMVLILGLVLFYIAHMQNLNLEGTESEERAYFLVFFNIILLGFIQATLSLRFTFPSISLEGRAFWKVMSSGVGMPRFFFTKYYLHSIILLVIGESMLYLLNSILQADATLWMISSTSLMLFAFGFTSWTMGLGAVFHKFDATSAADVSSNTGALVTMILTMIYFGVSAALLGRFALDHTPGVDFPTLLAIEPSLMLWVTLFLLWQSCAILIPVTYGLQKLRDMEW